MRDFPIDICYTLGGSSCTTQINFGDDLMKKMFAILLILIMLMSVAMTSAFAENVVRDGAVFEVSHYNPKYPTNGVTEDEVISNNVMATSELCELISKTCYCEVLRFDVNKLYVGLPFDCVEKVKELETVLDVKPYVETAVSSKTADEKISSQLREVIDKYNPQDAVNVSAWLCYNPAIYYGFCEEDFSDTQEYLEQKREVNAKYHEEVNNKFLDNIFNKVDVKLNSISKYSPMIFLSLKVENVEKLAQIACIDSIEYESVEPEKPPVDDEIKNLYEDKFVSKYNCKEYYYDELYHHKTDDGQIDWALVEADLYAGLPVAVKQLIFDRVITYRYNAMPFSFGYGIYDVEADDFVSLNSNKDLTRYQGLEVALSEIKLGNPLGDADLDAELTILDATYIQMAVAKLCDFKKADYVGEYSIDGAFEIGFSYISDIDLNGERNILDATAVQLKLAQID